MNENIIAIDGPAGSGKSSLAREIARQLGYFYMDSGAYYRGVTLFFLRIFHQSGDKNTFSSWISSQNLETYFPQIQLETKFLSADENQIFLNQENISDAIRTPEVTEEIKHLAGLRMVRDLVNKNLYKLSEEHRLVMDGRDIGTEVFPDARFKFFLTAQAQVRAQRRMDEWKLKGIHLDYSTILEDLQKRDKSDEEREIAPLKKAATAIEIDTSLLTKNQVLEKILSVIVGK